MKKLIPFLILIIVCMLLAGCRATPVPVVKTETPKVLAASPSVTPTNTLTPTSLPTIERTPTLKPTVKPAQTQGQETIPVCPGEGVPISPPDGFGFPGTIVYQDGNSKGLYTIGGTPLSRSQLPVDEDQESVAFGFTPDGEWFAFAPVLHPPDEEFFFESPSIILFSADGVKTERILNMDDFINKIDNEIYAVGGFSRSGYNYWINNQLIYVILRGDFRLPPPGGDEWVKMLALFEGSWLEEPLDELPNRDPDGEVGFSSDMSRALYQSNSGITLWDLISHIEIWSDPEFPKAHGTIIRWAPNSDVAAVANITPHPDEWRVVLISRDGEIINTIVDSTFAVKQFMFILGWSPDSRYLALVDNQNIYIYDSDINEFLYQCPIIGSSFPRRVIWSPDSSYIAYGGTNPHSAPDSPLKLLHVQSGQVYELVENAMGVGWSDKFPVIWP